MPVSLRSFLFVQTLHLKIWHWSRSHKLRTTSCRICQISIRDRLRLGGILGIYSFSGTYPQGSLAVLGPGDTVQRGTQRPREALNVQRETARRALSHQQRKFLGAAHQYEPLRGKILSVRWQETVKSTTIMCKFDSSNTKLEARLETKMKKGKTKNFVASEKDRKHKIRWDKTTGGSQWAEDKKQLDETPTWKELAEAVATTAEEIRGRKPRSSDVPCLESMKPEVLRIRKLVANSYSKVQEARGHPDEPEERERHKGVRKRARKLGKKTKTHARQGCVL